ncbi:MAG: RNA polymerase sigma factor [Bulleidia sp.]
MRCTAEYLAETYQQNLFRAALAITHNVQDAEDAVQNTFLKYLQTASEFDSEDHIRAWLFRTVSNQAKDTLRAFWHRNRTSLEDWMNDLEFEAPEDKSLVEAVLRLPRKYSGVIHLYYYEDYSVREIASILEISESAVKHRLQKGRAALKTELEKEDTEVMIHE